MATHSKMHSSLLLIDNTCVELLFYLRVRPSTQLRVLSCYTDACDYVLRHSCDCTIKIQYQTWTHTRLVFIDACGTRYLDGLFAVNAGTGLVSVATTLDSSFYPNVNLGMVVSDRGTPSLSALAELRVRASQVHVVRFNRIVFLLSWCFCCMKLR